MASGGRRFSTASLRLLGNSPLKFPSDLRLLSIKQLSALYLKKEISAVDVVEAYAAQADKFKAINAMITGTVQTAREAAKVLDDSEHSGEALWGIPIAVKDNFNTKVSWWLDRSLLGTLSYVAREF